MNCIKCGREIPDGDLFCLECSMAPLETTRSGEAPKPKQSVKQAPTQVKQVPPQKKPAAPRAPAPAAALPATKKQRRSTAPIVALVLVSLMLLGSLAASFYFYQDFQTQKANLRVKEADILVREGEMDQLNQDLEESQNALAGAQEKVALLEEEVAQLQDKVDGSTSSLNQSQYDLNTQQKELKKLTEENSELLAMMEQLEEENGVLLTKNSELSAAEEAYLEKIKFMDSYVVFVENDGSERYHKYDCSKFTKKSFWAYSRKLAESNGFSPCPICQ